IRIKENEAQFILVSDNPIELCKLVMPPTVVVNRIASTLRLIGRTDRLRRVQTPIRSIEINRKIVMKISLGVRSSVRNGGREGIVRSVVDLGGAPGLFGARP